VRVARLLPLSNERHRAKIGAGYLQSSVHVTRPFQIGQLAPNSRPLTIEFSLLSVVIASWQSRSKMQHSRLRVYETPTS
jgi:hypothetical protein